MRKIRKKKEGPTLRESWVMIVIAVVLVVVFVTVVIWGSRTSPKSAPPATWAAVVGVKPPLLMGLGAPRQLLAPEELARTLGVEGDLLAGGGGRWFLSYDLTAPPARADVMYFVDYEKAHDLLVKTPGLTAFAPPQGAGLGDEAFTGPGGVVTFRRGAVLVRVHPPAGDTSPPVAAAREMDQALQRTFGARP